jgi:26S proteasome regulatory subunit T1
MSTWPATSAFITTDDNRDIHVLKNYGNAPYLNSIKKIEKQIKEKQQSINDKIGVKV